MGYSRLVQGAPTANQPLFPVSGRVPGGKERKTHKMIERDLSAARDRWLAEAETDAENRKRIRSDFLCYCNVSAHYNRY